MISPGAANDFGELIDLPTVAPVAVAKYDRPVIVVVAVEEYERLRSLAGLAPKVAKQKLKGQAKMAPKTSELYSSL